MHSKEAFHINDLAPIIYYRLFREVKRRGERGGGREGERRKRKDGEGLRDVL